MARKHKIPSHAAYHPHAKVKKKSYISKIELLIGLATLGAGLANYFGWYDIPGDYISLLLVVAGVFLLYMAVRAGSTGRRKDVLKRYL